MMIWTPITIINSQSAPTPAPFQQMIQTTLTYQSGVRFWSPTDGWLHAWLESISGGAATIWVRIPSSIPAGGTYQLYMIQDSTLPMDGVYWGEAPQLSSTYGQYDNGPNVFSIYTNYAGTSLPSGFAVASDGANGSVTINNGATVTATNTDGTNGEFLYYRTPQNPAGIIIESLIISASSDNHDKLIGYDMVSPTDQGGWWGWSDGFVAAGIHNTDELATNVGNISGSTLSLPILVSLSWQTTNTAKATFNYNNDSLTVSSTPTIGSSYLVSGYTSSGGTVGYQWFRVRAYPPNGVMPSVSLGPQYSGELITVTVP